MNQRALKASVIIPNWNGLALLRPCLDTLHQQTLDAFEVIVVDNASSDDSVAVLQRDYPEVRTIALSENLGYSGGCNAGIREARGEIVVLLNNDIEAEPDWLAELVAALDRHPEAGFAASRMMIHTDRQRLNAAGDIYRRNGTPDSRGVCEIYGPPYDEETLVFGACGGAAAYRTAMLDEIGLLDERFFMYCEDVDLSWRAQLAGYRCVYAPKAVVYHHMSATGGGALSSYYVGRNTLWVIALNYPGKLLWRNLGVICGEQWHITSDALKAWRGASARARLRGQLVGFFSLIRWCAERRRRLRSRRVDDAYIASILD